MVWKTSCRVQLSQRTVYNWKENALKNNKPESCQDILDKIQRSHVDEVVLPSLF